MAPQKFLHFELRGIETLYGWLTQLHGPSVVKLSLCTKTPKEIYA